MTAFARAVMTHTGLATAVVLLCITLTVQTQAPTPLERSWPSEGPPRPLAARPVKFPPYDIRTLPNGLQVVLVSHHEQPAVSVRMIVRAGAARDPKGKLGLAMLTATLLDQGAGKRNAQEIADTIDFAGGILSTGAGSDLSYINTIVMRDSLPLALDLMADVARRPTFSNEEVQRQRQQALSSLKVSLDDPDNVAGQVIDRLIYGFHPYGLPGSGTPESLASLTRDDFVSFHRQFYVPNNALLAIVGDVSPEEAIAGVEKAFGDWEQREVPAFSPTAPPPAVRRVLIIDKPDSVQTEVRVGQLGVPRKHQDFVALDQAVKILGGEGANRLQQVLRSERGLTYGASADLDAYKVAGGIVAETDTRSDATAETLRVIVDQIVKLQRERVYDAELDGAQNYLVGHFPLTIETPDAIATQVLNQLFYELPLAELEEHRARIQSVGPEDIQRVAKEYFTPDRLGIVLVGNAEAFIKDLPGVGFSQFERIPIADVDLLAANFRRAANAAAPPLASGASNAVPPLAGGASNAAPLMSIGRQVTAYAERTSVAQADGVQALLKKATDARGGLDKLAAIKTITAESDTLVTTPQGKLTAKTRTFLEYPERMRVEADLPDGQQTVQVYANGAGWVKDPTGVHDVPAEMLQGFRSSARRDSLSLLVAAATGKLQARLLPDEGFKGQTLKVIEVSGEGLSPVRLYVDPQTGLVAKLSYDRKVDDPRAPPGPAVTEEVYDDYRDVDGVKFAFKASVTQGGMVILERSLTGLRINPTIAADLFAKPK
jgi:zinc protease